MKPAIFKWGVLEGRGMVEDTIPKTWKLPLPVKVHEADFHEAKVKFPGQLVGIASYREFTFKMEGYRNGLPLYVADIE